MFTNTFVINLPFKSDRLTTFQASVPKCMGPITVWHAVHGDTVLHPDWWSSGRGAWGCYRSHLQILEHCYNSGAESYIVFEDDAIFRPDFEQQLSAFLAELPDDWEQVYLGGQLLHEVQHPPKRLTENVYIPYNVNRPHGFAVHKRGYEKLYRHLNSVPFQNGEHIDHHLGRLHESGKLKIYCPAKWLVGQDGGPSNISGNTNSATYWVDPEQASNVDRTWANRPIPAVFLESTMEVAIELERRGWHRGHWQNEHRLDRGICQAIASPNVREGLHGWFKAVVPEAVREGKACVCLFHPSLMWPCVQSLEFTQFEHIVANSADEAEQQLTKITSARRASEGSFGISDGNETDACEDPSLARRARKRNLIYHVWPRKSTSVWQWNIDQLLQRINQFDGIRSIGVATSEEAESLETLQAAFHGIRIDNWITVPNDPQLGEVATFGKLLETLPKEDGSVTFYGHAKGVKYDDPMHTRDWTQMLYEVCLDDPAYVEASLDHHPTTGPFIRTTPWEGGAKHHWFFSGAFFWFRNADVFSKPEWQKIRQDYWGSELWPGSLFTRTEAGELFGQECGHLYEPQELARMQAWLVDWRTRRRNTTRMV